MSSIERDTSLEDVLVEAANAAARVRIYGRNMTIIAEGLISFIGSNAIGIKHQEKEPTTEFLRKDRIVKIQMLDEPDVVW